MPVIPDSLYRQCESRLRDRWAAIERAEKRLREARQRAYSVSAAPMDRPGGSGSGKGDALERKALAVAEAEQALFDALAWDDVIRRLDRIYPSSTPEGEVAAYLYGNGLTQADCCRLLHKERKRIRELKDAYIINCALLAIQAGLARMEEEHGTAGKTAE